MKLKQTTYWSKIYLVFLLALLIRFFLSPVDHVDEQRYLLLSDQILAGNFDLDAGSFLCAPFFPYFLAGLKYLSPNHWYGFLFILQVFISSLCVFSFYKIGLFLFKNKNTALTAALIYAVYPDTFVYVRLIGQEVFYQSFLIFSVQFLMQYVQKNKMIDIVWSAIFFSLCFQTKSFILFWSPFIVLYVFLNKTNSLKNRVIASVSYALICLVFTMPIGFYNLSKHNQYTLSSNGGLFLFYVGNSDYIYAAAIQKKEYEHAFPEKAAKDSAYQMYRLIPPTSELNQYYLARKTWGTVHEIQETFGRAAFQWIKDNPKKFWQLRVYNIVRFMFPGNKPAKASYISLFFIFLSAGILYFSAFMGIKKCLKTDFAKHNWLLTLWLTMLVFSIIFGTYTRFRTITIDSFFCLYAAFFLNHVFEKYKTRLPSFGK